MSDPIGEGVVHVERNLGVSPELEVALGHREVEDEQAALGAGHEVLGLLPAGVQRKRDGAVLREEPDLGELGPPVRANGGKRVATVVSRRSR